MVILMYDDENFEYKFSQVESHLKEVNSFISMTDCDSCLKCYCEQT